MIHPPNTNDVVSAEGLSGKGLPAILVPWSGGVIPKCGAIICQAPSIDNAWFDESNCPNDTGKGPGKIYSGNRCAVKCHAGWGLSSDPGTEFSEICPDGVGQTGDLVTVGWSAGSGSPPPVGQPECKEIICISPEKPSNAAWVGCGSDLHGGSGVDGAPYGSNWWPQATHGAPSGHQPPILSGSSSTPPVPKVFALGQCKINCNSGYFLATGRLSGITLQCPLWGRTEYLSDEGWKDSSHLPPDRQGSDGITKNSRVGSFTWQGPIKGANMWHGENSEFSLQAGAMPICDHIVCTTPRTKTHFTFTWNFQADFDSGCVICDKTERGGNALNDYKGCRSITVGGHVCQRWSRQVPHKHRSKIGYSSSFSEDHNHCRNPDNDQKGPWCFTTNVDTAWESCGFSGQSLYAHDEEQIGLYHSGKTCSGVCKPGWILTDPASTNHAPIAVQTCPPSGEGWQKGVWEKGEPFCLEQRCRAPPTVSNSHWSKCFSQITDADDAKFTDPDDGVYWSARRGITVLEDRDEQPVPVEPSEVWKTPTPRSVAKSTTNIVFL